MNNTVKALGILGIVIAAVEIYRKNKKVKETVDKAAETVKEKTDEVTDKAAVGIFDASIKLSESNKKLATSFCKFVEKHPKLIKYTCKYGFHVLVVAGCAVLAAILKMPRWKPLPETMEAVAEIPDHSAYLYLPDEYKDRADIAVQDWKANGLENWNKVIECADSLNLSPGERFEIYDIEEERGTEVYEELKASGYDKPYIVNQTIKLAV